MSRPGDRNVIGSHGGSYALYRALAVSSGALDPIRRPDLTNTYPAATIGPYPQWTDPHRIVSLDPWGHLVAEAFKPEIAEGLDIRPTIAITRARLDLHEMQDALAAGRLENDGEVVHANGSISVVKIAIDPVWYLPGIAERFGTSETILRRALFEQTAGMFPELVTRPDLEVFLPPIGGTTVYLFGDVDKLADPSDHDHLPRARRVQRLRRVRLRHLHLPSLSDSRHRGMRARGAGGRPRHHRL